MADSLKVYVDRLSQPCRAVELLLRVNNVPYDLVELNLALGEHRNKDYAMINRFRKVPAICDGKFNVCESVAILRYLMHSRQYIPRHWYPKGPKRRARIDEFLEWQHIELRSCLALYVRQMYFAKLGAGRDESAEMVQFYRKRMVNACDNLEKLWLYGNKKFLIIGDEITIADLLAVCELEELKLTGYDPREGRPKIAAWMDRVRNICNPHYDEIHAKLNTLATLKNPVDILSFLSSKRNNNSVAKL